MALDTAFESLAARADADARRSIAVRLAKRAKALWSFRIIGSYRKLFLDTNGQLTPAAVDFIADVSAVAVLGVADQPGTSDSILRDRAGRRAIALHIIGRMDLDGTRLRALAQQLREEPK